MVFQKRGAGFPRFESHHTLYAFFHTLRCLFQICLVLLSNDVNRNGEATGGQRTRSGPGPLDAELREAQHHADGERHETRQ
jgi:hypothetical protein